MWSPIGSDAIDNHLMHNCIWSEGSQIHRGLGDVKWDNPVAQEDFLWGGVDKLISHASRTDGAGSDLMGIGANSPDLTECRV